MDAVHKLDKRHQTRAGYIAFGLVELAAAYAFASWAIGSGRLLAWFLTIVFLIGGLQNFVKLAAKVVRHA